MKCFKRYINFKEGSGTVTLVPEDSEDMWHVFNLIQPGDNVKTTAQRKVTIESATGSTSSQRVTTTLTVDVETIDYDSHASILHLKGKNIAENQHVKLGAYHTLDLELQRKFTLVKPEWDSMHTYRLDLALNIENRADVAAVVMQEGLANVCLITPNMTVCKAKIDVKIPRKRREFTGQHDKAMLKFFDQVCVALARHVDFSIVKAIIIASPGFVRESFLKHLFKWAENNGQKQIIDNRQMFLSIHSSSGFKHALNEVLSDPTVTARLRNTKAQQEVKALADFNRLLANDPDRAYYGYKHVQKAVDSQAVSILLLCDHLFMSRDIAMRKKYVKLVEDVKDIPAEVLIFSVRHVSGEQLQLLSGVAAILRYPLPDIESSDGEPSDSDDEDATSMPQYDVLSNGTIDAVD